MNLRILMQIFLMNNLCLGFSSLWENMKQFLSGFPEYSPNILEQVQIISDEFDFVIIGAGSGGSVLTNRLTENPNWNVLLLEAGVDESFITDIPLMAPALHVTDYNWGYKSEPGGYCLAMVDGRCNFVRGKAIGGSSVVNFMIYSRGSPNDYDSWAAQGNPGWSYKDALPYFMKSENSRLVDEDPRFHGREGYLDVIVPSYSTNLRDTFLKAGRELGYDSVDYNTDHLIGFSKVQANLRNGRRWSAGKAFLQTIRDRKNLYLSKSSRVTKIIIDPLTKRARAVVFRKNGQTRVVQVTKEVLLCAGAFNSPQLLMLSGIGPENHLKSLGIELIQDSPVGYNLQDHVSMSLLTFLVNQTVTIVQPRLIIDPSIGFDYFLRGTGPLTLPAAVEGIAFINTRQYPIKYFDKYEKEEPHYSWIHRRRHLFSGDMNSIIRLPLISKEKHPDIELVLGTSALTGDTAGFFRGLLGLKSEFYNETFSHYEGMDAFSIVPILLHPKSRGRVSLRSANPFHDPVIEPNYYDHKDDLDTMIRGIKRAIEVATTKAFQRYNSTLLPMSFSGCKHLSMYSDDYWGCVCRHVSTTLGHFIGTCKMGTKENFGVVDHRLRVHGITGLRVVDASIIPQLMAGHTNAPVYMIAEKAADMIKEEWGFDF